MTKILHSIDHLIIAVKDLAAAEQQYSLMLGRQCSWRGQHRAIGSSNAIFRLANTYLELVSANGEGSFADLINEHINDKGEGLMGIAFGVDNIDTAIAQLRGQNIGVTDSLDGEAQSESGERRHWRMALLDKESMRGVFSFIIEPEDRLALAYSTLNSSISAQDFGARSAIDAVDHVVLNTSNPESFIELFVNQLGQKLLRDQTIEQWNVRQLFFRLGGVTLEVVCELNKNVPTDSKSSESECDRFWGLALNAPDINKATQRISQAGIDVSDVRPGRARGTAVATVKGSTLGVPTLLIGSS